MIPNSTYLYAERYPNTQPNWAPKTGEKNSTIYTQLKLNLANLTFEKIYLKTLT